MKRFLKTLFKTVLLVAILGAGAVTVLFECCSESKATAFVAPYCEVRYLITKAQLVRWYDQLRAFCVRGKAADPGPEPGAEAEEPVVRVEASAAAGEGRPRGVSPEADKAVEEEPVPPAKGASSSDGPPTLATAHWYTGKRVSESSCRCKVVVVCVWNADSERSPELLEQVQRIADGFGAKRDLVVFASHRGASAEAAVRELKRAKVTVPVCEGAGLPCAQRISGTPPYFYLVDKKGRLKYIGCSDKAVLTKMSELF